LQNNDISQDGHINFSLLSITVLQTGLSLAEM